MDGELQRWVVEHRIGLLNPVFEAVTYAGSFGLGWLALALVLSGPSWRRPWLPVRVGATILIAEGVQSALKLWFERERPPFDNPEPEPLVALPESYSLPSGHAVVAFACATVISFAVPRLRWPLYALAALVAFSRVYVGVHFPGDIVAGALLGVLLGLGVEGARRLLRDYVRRREAAGGSTAPPTPRAGPRRSPPGSPPG
jgi:undecaprenyl-diphosphatase